MYVHTLHVCGYDCSAWVSATFVCHSFYLAATMGTDTAGRFIKTMGQGDLEWFASFSISFGWNSLWHGRTCVDCVANLFVCCDFFASHLWFLISVDPVYTAIYAAPSRHHEYSIGSKYQYFLSVCCRPYYFGYWFFVRLFADEWGIWLNARNKDVVEPAVVVVAPVFVFVAIVAVAVVVDAANNYGNIQTMDVAHA